jgi:4'-phosphopantetheinyl transferase
MTEAVQCRARSPGPREIDLWRWPLDMGTARLADLEASLSDDERARRDRFYFSRDAVRYVAARGQLRAILADYLNLNAAEICFDYNEYGKPYLPGASLCFNLTHADGLAALAVASGRDVGVDIERVRVLNEDLIRWVMTEREQRRFLKLSPDDRIEAFFRCWTRKEAVVKAIGAGLSFSPERLEVAFGSTKYARLLLLDDELPAPGDWQLVPFAPAPGFVGAVAARGRPWILRPRQMLS